MTVTADEARKAVAALEQRLEAASDIRWNCDRALKPLGARKRNKPPEVLAQIQAEIDRLRAEKQRAIAIQNELEPQLKKLREQLAKLEKVEELNRRQAERDKLAASQNNGCGRHPGLGRDTTWRI
jgi:paraquat-inducible protein B